MSILSNLFDSLTGKNKEQTVTERPCSNCPSDCAIAGEACAVCEPYKKKLIDVLYYVDHLDEFLAKYEVADLSKDQVANCPYCGARSSDPLVCEYCGSKLSDGVGKIKVEKASDIPNPIMQAQNIIFERAECVIKQYSETEASAKGILSELLASVFGSSAEETENPLGAKMSEAEIKEAAGLYGVGIAEYLEGLDNGKYLTLAGKKTLGSNTASDTSAAIPGVAGVGALAAALLGNKAGTGRPPHPPADDRFRSRPDGHGQMQNGRPSSQGMNPPGRGGTQGGPGSMRGGNRPDHRGGDRRSR